MPSKWHRINFLLRPFARYYDIDAFVFFEKRCIMYKYRSILQVDIRSCIRVSCWQCIYYCDIVPTLWRNNLLTWVYDWFLRIGNARQLKSSTSTVFRKKNRPQSSPSSVLSHQTSVRRPVPPKTSADRRVKTSPSPISTPYAPATATRLCSRLLPLFSKIWGLQLQSLMHREIFFFLKAPRDFLEYPRPIPLRRPKNPT